MWAGFIWHRRETNGRLSYKGLENRITQNAGNLSTNQVTKSRTSLIWLPWNLAGRRPWNFQNHEWLACDGMKTPCTGIVNYSVCAVRNPNAIANGNYTHFAGLLKVNKLFWSDAKSLTPECIVHDQNTTRIMIFTSIRLTIYNMKKVQNSNKN